MEELREWFFLHRRELPWRNNPTPYAVWVSEVMLQQTQVAVVKPYFKRWMDLFPSVEALAKADRDAVIKAWEGLGYYSRARHLHEGAKEVVARFQGVIPRDEESLRSIKGLGEYTVGAMRSFAFHERSAAVDGNVMRVVTRLYRIEGEIERVATKREVKGRVLTMLGDEPWITMEALIELGALVCKKRPECSMCPLHNRCLGKGLDLPRKKAPVGITYLEKQVAIVLSEEHVLLKKRARGVMADLWEFAAETDVAHLEKCRLYKCDPVQHTFTRYRCTLQAVAYRLDKRVCVEAYEWIRLDKVPHLPFCSGHRRLWKQLSAYLSQQLSHSPSS